MSTEERAVPGLKCMRFAVGGLVVQAMFFAASSAFAQYAANPSGKIAGSPPQPQQSNVIDQYLKVPMVNLVPGGIPAEAKIKNPMANDPGSVERGMQYFIGFNCVGCHAPNGGGGMGPSLSSRPFIFGDDPANRFLLIAHGAPYGMPAWGELLPETVIWDLVSYIDSISSAPGDGWGTTVSPAANLPRIQQVPAEFNQTARPWDATQPFSGGQPSQK